MSYAVLCGLTAFSVVGTVIQWVWIWVLIKKVFSVEERLYCELAKFAQQIPADRAKNAVYDDDPKV